MDTLWAKLILWQSSPARIRYVSEHDADVVETGADDCVALTVSLSATGVGDTYEYPVALHDDFNDANSSARSSL